MSQLLRCCILYKSLTFKVFSNDKTIPPPFGRGYLVSFFPHQKIIYFDAEKLKRRELKSYPTAPDSALEFNSPKAMSLFGSSTLV